MSHGYKYQNQAGQTNMGQNPYYGAGQQNQWMNQTPNIGQNPYYGQNYSYPQGSGILPKINLFGETPSDKFLRGLLIGGAAAYILTNENAQKAIIKTGIKLFGSLAGGVEEFKEKIMDAKAELEAEQEEAAE
ncbi:MAG TPA: YtxH domain-containing protein [Campylobacterales bacterium]|nr:YtxH domain-containing protein [Campylobacterales bacterium]